MRIGKLKGQLMSVEELESFKRLICEFANFSCKERHFGARAVEAYGCEVSFDEGLRMMTLEQGASFDAEGHWQRILIFCEERGFMDVRDLAGDVCVQFVDGHEAFGEARAQLILYLAFDESCGQGERHRRFLQMPERAFFREVPFDGVPCYAAAFGSDVGAATRVANLVLKTVYLVTACECEVEDQAPLFEHRGGKVACRPAIGATVCEALADRPGQSIPFFTVDAPLQTFVLSTCSP